MANPANLASSHTPANINNNVLPAHSGSISTISEKMRQTIIVKVIKNNGEIVTHEFGSRFKNDGRNPLIVDYTPPNMENEGHYSIPDEILAKLKGFDINSFTPTGQNNCLYDALLPQINAETGQNLALTADKLRNIAEEFTLSNLCGNILHVASSLLNNPLTKQLHIKAQAALLVGGGISEAKDLKQKFIEQLKQLNLPGPDRTNLTLEKACHHDNKAISKINDMSPTLKKSKATAQQRNKHYRQSKDPIAGTFP